MDIAAPTAAPATSPLPPFHFDNTYALQLEGFFVPWQAAKVPQAKLVKLNRQLALELGLDADALDSPVGAEIFAGNLVPEGAAPLAQAYAGHQFGGLSPQLGDGRALLLGEVIDRNGQRRDIQFKGSGRTPFSRGGDGKASLGPVLREYILGEAMHALGIPTTRALAAVATGEPVFRETRLPGAVLTRVAASHIRVGTFQFFHIRRDTEKIRQLADYTIARHYPSLRDAANPYHALLVAVCAKQADLIAQWMHVGFIHGVMNTDNMAISGETIDYGPCAFLDSYGPQTVFSSIDSQGRYAYGNQPAIARWNLARFAETLLPLLDSDETRAVELATRTVNAFTDLYDAAWLDGMRKKLGLTTQHDGDLALANGFLSAMEGQNVDFTQAFRSLANALSGDASQLLALFANPAAATEWLPQWRQRLETEPLPPEQRAQAMNLVNPLYIARNHKVEEALAAAVSDDNLRPFELLLVVLREPFTPREGLESFALPEPGGNVGYCTYCGT